MRLLGPPRRAARARSKSPGDSAPSRVPLLPATAASSAGRLPLTTVVVLALTLLFAVLTHIRVLHKVNPIDAHPGQAR